MFREFHWLDSLVAIAVSDFLPDRRFTLAVVADEDDIENDDVTVEWMESQSEFDHPYKNVTGRGRRGHVPRGSIMCTVGTLTSARRLRAKAAARIRELVADWGAAGEDDSDDRKDANDSSHSGSSTTAHSSSSHNGAA